MSFSDCFKAIGELLEAARASGQFYDAGYNLEIKAWNLQNLSLTWSCWVCGYGEHVEAANGADLVEAVRVYLALKVTHNVDMEAMEAVDADTTEVNA